MKTRCRRDQNAFGRRRERGNNSSGLFCLPFAFQTALQLALLYKHSNEAATWTPILSSFCGREWAPFTTGESNSVSRRCPKELRCRISYHPSGNRQAQSRGHFRGLLD